MNKQPKEQKKPINSLIITAYILIFCGLFVNSIISSLYEEVEQCKDKAEITINGRLINCTIPPYQWALLILGAILPFAMLMGFVLPALIK